MTPPAAPRPPCEECIYQARSEDEKATIRNQTLDDLDWGDIIKAIEKKGYTVKIRKQDVAIIRTSSTQEQP